MKFISLSIVVIIAVLGQISLKKGLSGLQHHALSDFLGGLVGTLSNPFIVLALCCYGLGLFFYLFLLSRYHLTNIYPITSGLTLASITFFGVLFLKEPLTLSKLMGIVLIAVGVLFLER